MIVERRRLPSSSYHSSEEDWTKDLFAEQPIAVHSRQHEPADVARHVADHQSTDLPFFVMNVASVVNSVQSWASNLPKFQPHYALRCNSDPVLAQLLANAPGMGFEVSNAQELHLAVQLVDASRIIYSNPLWTRKNMRMAGEAGVGTIVVGNEKELFDAITYAPCSRILVAVSLDCPSREEFLATAAGCDAEEACSLLRTAQEMRANFSGFSFNVDNSDPNVYYKALREVRRLVDFSFAIGLAPDTICVGGGFRSPTCAEDENHFLDVCDSLTDAADQMFSPVQFPDLRWFACPGRFFASNAFSLCTNVIAKRAVDMSRMADYEFSSDSSSPVGFVYQTNDGIYGSFGCRLADCNPQCRPLKDNSRTSDESTYLATVIGPSMEAFDIAQRMFRGRQLAVGEWLLWENMGAYSMPYSTQSSPLPVYYYAGRDFWECVIENNYAESFSDCFSSYCYASDSVSDSEETTSDEEDDDLITCFDSFFESESS